MFFARADPTADDPVGRAFTDRLGGVTPGPMGELNLGRSDADEPAHVVENLRRVRRTLGLRALYTVRQVHAAEVVVLDEAKLAAWGDEAVVGDALPGGEPLVAADAVVTTLTGVGLAIRVADCLPVLLSDAGAGVVGAAHAGRDGLRRGVLDETVRRMAALGATTVSAVIGPHVCGECYELPSDLVDAFDLEFPGSRSVTSWGTPAVDLAVAAETRLSRLGCRVTLIDGCTRTDPSLHSHRRDGSRSGRQIGLIWRVSPPDGPVRPG